MAKILTFSESSEDIQITNYTYNEAIARELPSVKHLVFSECSEEEMEVYRNIKNRYLFLQVHMNFLDYCGHYQDVRFSDSYEEHEIDDELICVYKEKVVGFAHSYSSLNKLVSYHPIESCDVKIGTRILKKKAE